MTSQKYSDDFLQLAATLCYVDGMPQQQVARMMNVSQAKVSRLLAAARERGIVQISVSEYCPRNKEIEKLLRERFKFKDVIVVRIPGSGNIKEIRKVVGYFAGRELQRHLQPGMTLGLAGGRTIQHLVDAFEPEGAPGAVNIVQLMGNVGPLVRPFDASELGRLLAQKLQGAFFALNMPVYTADRFTRDKFQEHVQVKMLCASYKQLDVAVVGVGVPGNSILTSLDEPWAERMDELRSHGVVGEVCGRFFDAAGDECDTFFRDKVIAASLDDLRTTEKVYGVVSGSDRTAGIVAAVRGGIINSLIIDEYGALRLLEFKTATGG